MILHPKALRESSTPHWFCVRTQQKREHFAASNLRRLHQIECFCPRLRYRKLTNRGSIWFLEALFPGYIFARFDYEAMYRQAQCAPGIHSLLKFGDGVAAVDEATIAELRKLSGIEETIVVSSSINVGDQVCISEGAFHGLEAIVTQILPEKERIRVLIEFLGRAVEAEIDVPKIMRAGA